MPGKGYSTIGLKPDLLTRLHNITNTYYPGMFLPSTLIIMMNEVKRGYYTVNLHNISLDLSGRYNSITIRLDVDEWLKENYKELKEKYEQKYHVRCFSRFTSYFLANLFESKLDAQNHVIRLKESNFEWLQEEYVKFKANSKLEYPVPAFAKFADVYLNELSNKIKVAKEVLTLPNFSSLASQNIEKN
jgi:tRNA(Met) C34 N-acetyltransferase TmcA